MLVIDRRRTPDDGPSELEKRSDENRTTERVSFRTMSRAPEPSLQKGKPKRKNERVSKQKNTPVCADIYSLENLKNQHMKLKSNLKGTMQVSAKILLPEKCEQNDVSLLIAEEYALSREMARDSFFQFADDSNMWCAESAEQTLVAMLSGLQLMPDAHAIGAKIAATAKDDLAGSRIVLPPVQRKNYLFVAREEERTPARSYESFFEMQECQEDEEIAYECRPSDYPIFCKLKEKYGREFDEDANYMQNVAMHSPKPDIPIVSRAYVKKFRLPKPYGWGERKCANGSKCKFWVFRGEKPAENYVANEFLLPNQLDLYQRTGELPVEVGACVDCVWYHLTLTVFSVLSCGGRKSYPLNAFSVQIGRDDYNAEDCLPLELMGKPTGIVGMVPAYRADLRRFVVETLPDGKGQIRYLAEMKRGFP